MTNSSNPKTESISPKPRRWRRILIWGGVGLGVTTIAVGTAATWFVKEKLAPMIGDIVGNIVQRPVIVGPVERVTPTSIRFGPSSIPATENNPNNASTEAENRQQCSRFYKVVDGFIIYFIYCIDIDDDVRGTHSKFMF